MLLDLTLSFGFRTPERARDFTFLAYFQENAAVAALGSLPWEPPLYLCQGKSNQTADAVFL